MQLRCFILIFTGAVAAPLWAADDVVAPDYSKQIAPIFAKYCNGCHNTNDREGKLALTSYADMLSGGERGAAISGGHSDQSLLYRVLSGQSKPAMPPEDNEKPTAAEIELIKRWIDAGAKGPAGAEPDPTILVVPQIKPTVEVRRAISSVAYSPKSDLVAVGRYRTVELIDPATRKVRRILSGHAGAVNDLVFSGDGTRLVAVGGEAGLFGEVVIWNVEDALKQADAKPLTKFRGHKDSIYSAAISPDGMTLATGSYDQNISLWDLQSGKEQGLLEGHNGGVFGLAFHPRGKWLASASGDRTIKLWDVARKERLETFSQPTSDQYTVAFSPDGKMVAGAGGDNRIRVWRLSDTLAEGTNPLQWSKFAHDQPILRVAYSADGKTVLSSAEDRQIKLWNAKSMTERKLLEKQPDFAGAVAFASSGAQFAVGRLDGSLAVYDSTKGEPIAPAPPPKPEIGSIWPSAIQRGHPSIVRVFGKNLSEEVSFRTSNNQVSAKVIDVASDGTHLGLELTAMATVKRGSIDIHAEGPGGKSGNLAVQVDDLSQVTEVESTGGDGSIQQVTLPTAVWGRLPTVGEKDRFQFQASAGQTIVIDVSHRSLGSKDTLSVALKDPNGKIIEPKFGTDPGEDPLLKYALPVDGVYTLQINEATMSGGGSTGYSLTIGSLPYVEGCYPLSIPANSQTEVELVGHGVPVGTKVLLNAGAGGEMSVPVDAEKFRKRRDFKVLVSTLPEVLEQEPNDTPAMAQAIRSPGSVNGRMYNQASRHAPDVDFYRFSAKQGEQVIVETTARRSGSPVDTRIDVLTLQGEPITRLQLQAVRNSFINFRGVTSASIGLRLKNWEEMELNDYIYIGGEVCRLFRAPEGPDSDSILFEADNSRRRTYFDTSPVSHANYDPVYVVEPHPAGAKLAQNGLPIIPIYYSNDDASDRDISTDSRVIFTAPMDGEYLVRVRNTFEEYSPRHAYRLTLRPPGPDFSTSIYEQESTIPADSGQSFILHRKNIDGFDGPVTVEAVGGLPKGFSISSPVVIAAGHPSARGTLFAAADAVTPKDPVNLKLVAKGQIDGKPVVKEFHTFERLSVGSKPQVTLQLLPAGDASSQTASSQMAAGGAIEMQAGETIRARIKIERNNFKDHVGVAVLNLPHGVIVDNLGLNGLLINPGETEREIFLTAAPWVEPQSCYVFARALVDKRPTSVPVQFTIKKPEPNLAGNP
ncbi:MAG: c-type cytochrome domain-containing protein [Planctomycetota bacterium]|nr:c-type cytochrome domain-containing protein [Planctomycetota bacterium]